jgi:selenocysteine lyase/cysteine desulfurase
MVYIYRWLYTPRGVAVLYVPLKNQHLLRTTLATSWGFIPASADADVPSGQHKSAFETLFEQTATDDDSPYFTIPTALCFRQDVCRGEDAIYTYLEKLSQEGSDAIASILGTEVLSDPEGDLRRCALATVRLPLDITAHEGAPQRKKISPYRPLTPQEMSTALEWIQSMLVNKYNTMVPLFEYAGAVWLRVSAQIYLEKRDYEWLGGVLRGLCERVGKRDVDFGKVLLQGKF